MNTELEVLIEVLQTLERAGLEYMLTGSIAKIFYSNPRMTRDIDIVLNIFEPNISTLVSIFQSKFYIDPEAVEEAIKNRSLFNIIHNEKMVKVDFIVKKDSPFHALEFQRRRKVQFVGINVWIVTREDLILSKLDWAKDSFSEMQLGDIRDLIRNKQDIDFGYLEEWVTKLGLEVIYSAAKDRQGKKY